MSEPYDPTSLEGVPDVGRARLEQNKRGLFTSDLSVNEFLLVKDAGFDPLGLVVGSSIYHIGYQQSSWKQSQEMEVLSQAMYHARDLAMTRMEAEAAVLGADGIVGVRLEIEFKEFGADRIVWSGDSPHIADVHMKGYSAADIAKVKGGNLQRLLNW